MKNLNKKQEAKVQEMNVERFNMADFLAKRNEAQNEILKAKTSRKAKTSERKLGKENYILLDILNSTDKGITAEMLLALNNQRDASTKSSPITINHNWNRKSMVQRGEEKLRTPYIFDAEYILLKNEVENLISDLKAEQDKESPNLKTCEKLQNEISTKEDKISEIIKAKPCKVDVFFDVKITTSIKGKGNNNRIYVAHESMYQPLKEYLMEQGAKPEQFWDFVADDVK